VSRTPERIVKDKVIDMLDAVGAVWCAPVGSVYGRSDQLDFIACLNGRYLEIETKAGRIDKTTALQARKVDAVRAAGGVAVIVNAATLDRLSWALAQILGVEEEEVHARIARHLQEKLDKKRSRGKRIIHVPKE
jgi:hypothetical protein